jgi:hypothetical protein
MWLKFLFIGIVVILSLFLSAYLLLASFGKPVLIKQLQELTHKKVSLGDFTLTPPLRMEIKNLKIEGLLRADSILISPSMFRLLLGQLALNRVIVDKPIFFFEKNPEAVVENQNGAAVAQKAPLQQGWFTQNKTIPWKVMFVRLEMKNGRIVFVDHTITAGGLKLVVKDINLTVSNLYSFASGKVTSFDLKGNIPWNVGQEAGTIDAVGWINFSKKDMQATLKIHGIDGIYLYPYYSNWVDLEKARIEKANLNFDSNITGKNNDIRAECRLELANIVRKARPPEEPEQKAERITNVVLDIFKALDQGKVVLDFTVRTKMDKPEFGFGNVKMAFESKLSHARGGGLQPKDVVVLPAKLLEGAIRGGRDMGNSVIQGIFAVGNEFKKVIVDTFGRPPKVIKPSK